MRRNDKTTRIAYIAEAGLEYFISLFVTGTMLTYILDTIGFSDALQGIISTVATFTCGAQLFSLVLSGRKKKRLVTLGHLINQGCFTLLYLIPLFSFSPELKTLLLLVLLFTGHIVNNAINPSKITWLMTSVPDERRGRFTATKEMVSLAGGIIVSIVSGAVADTFRDSDGMPTEPYYIICAVALLVMMLLHTVSLLVSVEKPEPDIRCTPFRESLVSIINNKKLVKVLGVGIFWNITSALSTSFFSSYLREELAYSFTVIALITTVASVCRIIVSPILGKIADKYSFATSMSISFGVVALGFLAMVFTRPETRILYLVYASLHAFAMAGINSGVINLIYDYVAPPERAAAMGIKNALGGIIGFFVALFSGFLLGRIQQNGGFSLFGANLYAQQLLALFSCIGCILLVIYMRAVIVPMRKVNEKE